MSNKDINNHDIYKKNIELNLSMKETMHLFSLNLLKSKSKRTLTEYYNSFHYVFPKDYKPNNNKIKDSSINNRKISLIEGDNNSSLKTLNIDIPTADRLSKENFKNDFMNDYENSFAFYCGINKAQFEDIYVKNRYIPIINEFGDITISIKNIVDLLKTYSINTKVGRKILKRNRIKKIFKTQKKKGNLEKTKKNRFLFQVKKTESINKKNINNNKVNLVDMKKLETMNKNSLINEMEKMDDIKKENHNTNIRPSGFGINYIKHKLIQNKGNILIPKISNQRFQLNKGSFNNLNNSSIGIGHVPKPNLNLSNNSFFNYNKLSNDGNKKLITNNISNNPVLGFSTIPDNKQNISPSNNNIFNFSKINIQNIQNRNYGNSGVSNTNLNNNILPNNMINNNMNYHSQINNQLLSPQLTNILLSPKIFLNDILSPYSPYAPNSNISTPRIISPSFNNNIFQDPFSHNNINGNAFFFGNNSPANINNNKNLNNIVNNNLNINNKNINTIGNSNNIINNLGNNIINNKKSNNSLIDKNVNNDLNNKITQNNNSDDLIRKNLNNKLKINLNSNLSL